MNDLIALCWGAVEEAFASTVSFEISGVWTSKLAVFQNTPLHVPLDSGEYMISYDPLLLIAMNEAEGLKIGTRVKHLGICYQIITKSEDTAKGVVTCELAKAKN